MAACLDIKFVNGVEGDPAVYIQLPQSAAAVLLDAGDLNQLSNKELLKVRLLCVSHTHVDHFIGFDRLLRVNVPHFRNLEIVGPPGIVQNVCGKLAGYNWNLLEPEQITFTVHEVTFRDSVCTYQISNTNQFEPILISEIPSDTDKMAYEIPTKVSDLTLKAALLDHGIPVCGYSLQMPEAMTVSKTALEEASLEPGPWIGQLQKLASDAAFENLEFDCQVEIGGKVFSARDLSKKILTQKPGEKISYVTDVVFSKENLLKISSLIRESDTFICETNYRDEHRQRALAKKHLTTRQAALLAASGRCKNLKIFHISNIYAGSASTSDEETQKFFKEYRDLGPDAVQAAALQEIEG